MSDAADLVYSMSPVKDDFVAPPGFEKWNRAIQGAYRKGWNAQRQGKKNYECPYQDKRNYKNRITFSRSFIIAWHDGYSAAEFHPIS